MKKLYDKIMKINIKKNIISIIIIGLIFCIAAGAGTFVKFGNRIQNAKQQVESSETQNSKLSESDQDNNSENDQKESKDKKEDNDKKEHKEKKEDKKEIIIKNMNLDVTDYVFIGAVSIVGVLIAAYYWILVLIYSIKKSEKVGASKIVFGILTLFTNVIGVILLHMYIYIRVTCPNCGKILKEEDEYCSRCGQKMKIKCPNCENMVSTADKYCSKCGTKLG